MTNGNNNSNTSSQGGGFKVTHYPENVDNPNGIAFQRLPVGDPQPSKEQTEFASAIDTVMHRINRLMSTTAANFADQDSYRDYYIRVFYAAQNGVAPTNGDLVQGMTALESAKAYFIANEGPHLRKFYLHRLHRITVTFIILAIVSLVILEFVGPGIITIIDNDWLKPLQSLAIAVLGICLGTWLTRMLANETLTWDNLRHYGTNVYSPTIRYIMLIALTILLMILLGTKMVELKVMEFDLSSFISDPKSAVVLGLMAGIAEKRMTNVVLNAFAE